MEETVSLPIKGNFGCCLGPLTVLEFLTEMPLHWDPSPRVVIDQSRPSEVNLTYILGLGRRKTELWK